jgi:cell division protein FtsX
MSLRVLQLLAHADVISALASLVYFGTWALVEVLTNSGMMHNSPAWAAFLGGDWGLLVLMLTVVGATISWLAKRELRRRTPPPTSLA